MDNVDLNKWNSGRYQELNAYFRVKIKTLLESDPFLQEHLAQHQSLQLQDIVGRMTQPDQQAWAEFIELDQIKMQIDLQNHLEGKGTPFDSQNGFGSGLNKEENFW